MAVLSADGQYVTVQKGDCLWNIASKFLGSGTKYTTLANINGKKSPYYIYVGEKIYLYSKSSSSGGSGGSSSSTSTPTQVTIKSFGLQADADNVLFVTWDWSRSNTDSYLVEWSYYTNNKIWFIGSSSTTTVDDNNPEAVRQSTYSIPSNAIQVRVRIKPISETKDQNGKSTTYWTASWSSYKTYTDSTPLATPGKPSVEIEDYKLTVSIEDITISGATVIEFQVYKNDGSTVYKTGKANISVTKSASYSWTVDPGGEYKARCRASNGTSYSGWSSFTSGYLTPPAASDRITAIKANSETSVYLEWSAADSAKTYDIEYTTKKSYFDYSDQTTTKSGIEFTKYEITGLATGEEYFFRVRAVNEKGASPWSEPKSVKLGTKPSAPTTWSSTTTCITGEALTLYWVHNSEDGSSQTYAELEITIGGNTETHTIKNSTDEEEKDKTSKYVIDTKGYVEGTKIQWRVRTAGITLQYGDWSVERTVDIYAPPTLTFKITDADGNDIDTLNSFPFYAYALAGPNTQVPIGYHLAIMSNSDYETVDNIGNPKIIKKGETVYSSYFDTTDTLLVEFTPANIDLENNIGYTATCTVSMNSGLRTEESDEFSVAWTEESYYPDAEIGYDPETYVTHIRPYCMVSETGLYQVDDSNTIITDSVLNEVDIYGVFTTTDEEVLLGKYANGDEFYYCVVDMDRNGNLIDPVYCKVTYNGDYIKSSVVINKNNILPVNTTTGENILIGTVNGTVLRYCVSSTSSLVEGITLAVYRREFDGGFTELATGIKNLNNTYITDPHPALDYARYRVIAVSDSTGAISYYDLPGYPIKEVGIIIQWDDQWSNFDLTESEELAQPAWSGSLLRLPYNIDVSDNNNPDVAHVEYIGRKHPVTYYGTHLGSTASWKVDVPRIDKETIYGLRRLMNWMGDVYVREPSGSGYWANIKVSFSQTHREVSIPVSLSITRVEGGA